VDLDGAAAIVTGSVRGIGRAVALALAEAGVSVVINARHTADAATAVKAEVEAIGGRAIIHMADVTVPGDVRALVRSAVDAFGRLDILVNNVAHRIARPITETSYEDWRGVLSSTLDSAFLCSQAAVPHMVKQGGGAIVNIGGVSGQAGVANRSAVATAKAGLSGMTAALAVELAPLNITVNCVAPGHIAHHDRAEMSAHFKERAIPLGRSGRPEEVAAMVRLLCSPEGRYVSGDTIHVNGAWHVSIA
jgi:3-oxoacyl-[acyl-carrier protein] reductase